MRARVTDQAQLLAPDREAALEAKLASYERETGHQIAVLTVATTEGEPIEMYALRVAEAWKLGRAGADNGALLIVASQDRAARIEVGYGLEGALNDAISKRVIEEAMIPRFREGDFAGGLDAATDWMMQAARGDALPEPQRSRGGGGGGAASGDPITFLLFLAFLSSVVSAPFRKRMRPVGALLAGGVAGAIAWFVLHVAAWSALAFVVGALFGWMGPSAGMAGGRRGGSWGGGGFGGGRGGSWGGGGGGFGGGGGSFGGGGASGRW